MTLSRSRRIATGLAAGVIVLCAALIGASFRDSSSGVSVASEARVAIPIPELEDIEPDEVEGSDEVAIATDENGTSGDTGVTGDTEESPVGDDEDPDAITDPVRVIEEDDLPDPALTDPDEAGGATTDETAGETDTADADPADTDPATTDPADAADADPADADAADTDPADGATDATDTDPPPPAPTAPPTAPPLANDGLGTGGGVNDAECGLDRLVIYAGAPVGGVAGRLRSALASAGFGAGCPTPVVVLAANCPLQFSGVLPAGTNYDPQRSYVASSATVDRTAMTDILGSIGYTGAGIDVLPFGFAQADKPGERWMAVFVPPSFSGWEGLAGRAGLGSSPQSLCGPTGRVGS